jgi:FlaA1/EpsC-like NDP-sugar epimerase
LHAPRIEDLLEREQIHVDVQKTRKLIAGQIVLVTGAGGSIGSELCRQVARAKPRKLLLLDKSENSLFYAHLEVCGYLEAARATPYLADLLEGDRLRTILRAEQPNIIFHAAAHKHVGILELHPHEAIRNNVIGTHNIAKAALEYGTGRFVNISTDKAVRPCSYMGLSKKFTELCIQELSRNSVTRFSNVRFGNVAGSTGSVLRLFWEQIQKGGPVRVTDPRATRYFMSIPEAVHLILRAAALGKNGETFVFDMGEPINIYDLAKKMIRFAGFQPGRDLPVEIIGLRPGEKVEEELWESWEQPVTTECKGIRAIHRPSGETPGILRHIRNMERFLAQGDREGLLEYAVEILPDFKRNREVDIADQLRTAQDAPLSPAEAV